MATHDHFSRGAAGARAERRWSARRREAIPVRLYQDGLLLSEGVSRDLGLEGMFVYADSPLLTQHMLLELELALRAERLYRLQALVVHADPQGVGLMFVSSDRRLFAELRSRLDA